MIQKNCIKVCVKNEIKYARSLEMLAYCEYTMSTTQVQLWYNGLKENRENVNDDARPGLPSTSTTDENIKAVKR